jgi:hypothetical protein
MSITHLAPTGEEELLARMSEQADVLNAYDVSVAPGDLAVRLLQGSETLIRQLNAFRLRSLARVEATHAARAHGATGSAGLLRGTSPGQAKRDVALARQLDSHGLTAEAMSEGAITAGHAQVITGTTDQLPPLIRARGEARLVEAAKGMDPVELRKEAKRVLNDLHPDGPELLGQQEVKARGRREFTLSPNATGGYNVHGYLDVEGAALVSAAVDALAAPRPSTTDGPDLRPAAQRRGEAIVEVCRRSAPRPAAGGSDGTTGGTPDESAPRESGPVGDRPQVVVTMTLDQLLGHDESMPTLTAGTVTEPITAATARRYACDAAIIPIVLGGQGEVLDVGRARRTLNRAQRRALVYRDRGCTFPGCGRPAAWSEAHHIKHWAHGGTTDLDNLALLCDYHHGLVHNDGWTITIDTPGGKPRFHPPTRPPRPPPRR